ncbi:MAG: ElaA protein [Pseudohongiellaceae bacterium]
MTCLKNEMKLSWQWFHYSELGVEDLHDLLTIRQLIFIVEQASIYLDADMFDRQAYHLCVRDAAGTCAAEADKTTAPLVAYARVIAPKKKAPEVIIGRILVEKSYRGNGLASMLVERCLEQCRSLFPDSDIKLSAQCHLIAFYSKFGFETIGKRYDDGGIEHVDMIFSRQQQS